jgi:hypothetical protein
LELLFSIFFGGGISENVKFKNNWNFNMKTFCLVIISVVLLLNGFSQSDTTEHNTFILEDDVVLLPILTYTHSKSCQKQYLRVSKANVICCNDIQEQGIIPHPDHVWQLKPRLIENTRHSDSTLSVSFVLKFVCCAAFRVELDCSRKDTLHFVVNNVSTQECFCGGCIYLFTFQIDSRFYMPVSIFVNNDSLDFSEEIYINEERVKRKNIITRKKTVYYYSDNNLMMVKQFDRKGILISVKYFHMGIEAEFIEE